MNCFLKVFITALSWVLESTEIYSSTTVMLETHSVEDYNLTNSTAQGFDFSAGQRLCKKDANLTQRSEELDMKREDILQGD